MRDAEGAARLIDRVRLDFPEGVPRLTDYGYRGSLALCAIDSVFSLSARYGSTRNTVDRYRAARVRSGADPSSDSLHDLVAAIEAAGGPEAAAAGLFANSQLAPGTKRRKAEALDGVARRLTAPDVAAATTDDLRALAGDPATLAAVEAAWRSEPGLGYASWRYVLMLAGVPGVKIDRMVKRYVSPVLGSSASTPQIEAGFEAAASAFEVQVHELDHAVWRLQSGRVG